MLRDTEQRKTGGDNKSASCTAWPFTIYKAVFTNGVSFDLYNKPETRKLPHCADEETGTRHLPKAPLLVKEGRGLSLGLIPNLILSSS